MSEPLNPNADLKIISSNTTSSAGNAQYYGVDANSINEQNKLIYGFQDIEISNFTGVGIWAGQVAGEDKFFTSRSIVKTLDLLSEGEIEGIVSGEYIPSGNNPIGQLGWQYVNFQPYSSNPEAFLRSIYLNDTPVVNVNNQYNFQNLEASFFNGSPEGLRPGDNFLNVGQSNTVEKTRVLSERLRGPDIGGNEENPWYYHPKIYRILNPHAEKIRVNLKIATLGYTKTTQDFPEGTFDYVENSDGSVKAPAEEAREDLGREYGTFVTFKLRYRPIYIDDNGILDFNTNRTWYPEKPITSAVQGIVKSAYIHKIEIEPPDDLKTEHLAGWEIEITRNTLDSIQSNVFNETYVESITDIYEDSLSYPHSAMVSMNFNAEFFTQLPNRSYDVRLLRVKVPKGYDPVRRHYATATDGSLLPWDGLFQGEEEADDGNAIKAWTDNPAWIFYDLITNKRYGLGKFLENTNLDKWTLYEISKFCDVLVPNGEGGVEPRFTCNTLINTREEAYKVLKDFASCFRSILYYGFGNIHTIQDRPKDTIAQFTNSSVLDGDFIYSSSTQRSRPTVCLVRYNDNTNFYKPAIEYVEDVEGIRKHGIVEKEITAFACTSRSQALRLGRWILSTEAAQTETVSFTVGAEGMILRPGDVISLVDENRAAKKWGGRIEAHDYHSDAYHTSGILLNRIPELETNKNYTMVLTTPSYFYDASLVSGLTSDEADALRKPHVQTFGFNKDSQSISLSYEKLKDGIEGDISGLRINYDSDPSQGEWMFESSTASGLLVDDATWTIIDDAYASSLFTIVTSKEENRFQHRIEALLHEPKKYDFIESGVPYSFIPVVDNVTVAPPPPDAVSLSLVNYNNATSNTKKINITVDLPDELGTTVGYKIYVKESSNFVGADTVSPTSSIPKPEYLAETIYLSDKLDNNGNPYTYYIPPRNNKTYYFRVFGLNSTSVMSNGHVDANQAVTNHFPIKDVKIHGLRIYNGNVTTPSTINPAEKTLFSNSDSKDTIVQWNSQFLNEVSINIPITYRVTIHEPNTNSSTPLAELGNGRFTSVDNDFNFTFSLNMGTDGGPRRHFDLVVQAVDENGVTSSDNLSNSTGWDIVEVLNPRPTNYWLTPRKDGGKRPGDYKCCNNVCENIHTEQFIDSDGLIVVNLLNNSFTDLAGGFLYLSKHPFSGNDFSDNGKPKDLNSRPNIKDCLGEDEAYRQPEYNILEIPFEAAGGGLLESKITLSPPSADGTSDVFNYGEAYYCALKLYDSFDREINRQGVDPNWDKGIHIGFARNHEASAGDGIPLKGMYKFSSQCSGFYVGDYENGVASCTTGTFSCPIFPTKYFSASASAGFKYWIRMNVNGQWEGNGIEKVKVLSYKDVKTLYDYKGYYEYSCYMTEQVGGSGPYIYPNRNESITRCRFRQGQTNSSGSDIWYVDDIDDENNLDVHVLFGPYPMQGNNYDYLVTGATRRPSTEFTPLPKAGIPYGNWGNTYTAPNSTSTAKPDVDKILSLNERDQVIEGKSRPLLGFRRYRVYFDPNNLPEPAEEGQLSPYSVVGLNSWNGPYEGWNPAGSALTDSLLFAKDGVGAFPRSVRSWIKRGDLFENIPGVWNHHPAGFGQGFGGLIKTHKYFDIHLGRLIDDSYLNEGFFGVVATNDYSISDSTAKTPVGFDQQTGVHEATYLTNPFVTLSVNQGGDGTEKYPFDE
jgi:hypothetical protein